MRRRRAVVMALSLLLGSTCASVPTCGDEEGTVLSSFQGAENLCDVYGENGGDVRLPTPRSVTITECGKSCADHADCLFYSWWGPTDAGDGEGWCEISATCNNRGTRSNKLITIVECPAPSPTPPPPPAPPVYPPTPDLPIGCVVGIGDGYSSPRYEGGARQTTSGKPCQFWEATFPHDHKYDGRSVNDDGQPGYGWPNVGKPEHNYCRNPGMPYGTRWNGAGKFAVP